MAFFKPTAVFFIIKKIFNEDTHINLIKWLNSLGNIVNFNNENASIFVGDEMIIFGKSMDFLKEERFVKIANKVFVDEDDDENAIASNRSLIWRRHTLVWAGEHCKNLEGDFCDFGCYDGLASKFIYEYCDLENTNVNFYLYDVFDNPPLSHKFPKHSPLLFENVSRSFEGLNNVNVIKGLLPKSLKENYPEKISFAHIDLNNAKAEMGVLEFIFDRIVPGGMIIFDDYGWVGYEDQQAQEKEFMKKHDLHILELPTGQGLVIKR